MSGEATNLSETPRVSERGQPADLVEISAAGGDAAKLAQRDFNFFAALIDPDQFILLFPAFYLTLFSLLTAFTKKVERFAIGIPRGFAKTTFIKLLCIWYILFTDRKFILVVGAAEKLAVNTLADICDMLASRNVRALFGDYRLQMEEDTKEQKVFFFRGRNIVLKAIGAGTAIRGINRKSSRPDVMILDDVQRKEDSENKELSDELLKWILGTLMMARSNTGCTYIYVGNMYPQNCILEKLKQNSQWTSLIVGGLLADGSSLWEELKPAEELIAEYTALKELGHEEIFITEVLNSTDVALPSGIDINKFPHPPEYMLNEKDAEGSFILIDPSSGKKTGDDCSLELFTVFDGVPIFTELESGTFSPLETIKAAIAIGLRTNTRLICVEDVAYQGTLLFWFNHYCTEQGISGFYFEPTTPKGRAKNNRIKKGALKILAGEIYLHPRVRSIVCAQYVDWNPLKIDNVDDTIDGIGYVEEVMATYPELIVRNIFETDVFDAVATHDPLSVSSNMATPF